MPAPGGDDLDGENIGPPRPDIGPARPGADEADEEAGPPPPDAGDSDGDIGPAAPPKKKRKVLEYEDRYLEELPGAQMYERSYMHRDHISCVVVAPRHDFIITGSIDGHVKFWKKKVIVAPSWVSAP